MRTSAITVLFRSGIREKKRFMRIIIVTKSSNEKNTSISFVTNSIKVAETTGRGKKSGTTI